MRKTSVAILVVALVMGLSAAVLARNWIRAQAGSSAATQKIVVATQALSFGTELSKDNTTEIDWPAARLPAGAFASEHSMLKDGSRVVLTPIERNEPILASKVTGPGQRGSLSNLLKEDMRAVTVRVDDVRGVAGFVLPGDRVDVVLIRTDGTRGAKNYADVIVQNVKVLAVDQKANERPNQANLVAKAVTLAVSPENAQKILLAVNIGKISLTLRKSGETGREDIRRITEHDLVIADALPPPPPKAKVVAAVPAPTPPPPPRPVVRNQTVLILHGMKPQEYTVEGAVNPLTAAR
jgi:pilus assembly protein CpaB